MQHPDHRPARAGERGSAPPPRVALFLPSLEGGGAERVFVNLARGFLDVGLRVDFVLSSAVGPLLRDLPVEARLIDLERPMIRRCLPRLVGYLRDARPQALIAGLDRANLAAVLARHLAGTPTRVAVTVHIPRVDRGVTGTSWWSRLLPPLMRWGYPWADRVIAVSDGVADHLAQLTRLPREKIDVVYNPVITPQFWERAREDPDDPSLFADGRPVLLGVGRLHGQKDFPNLLRAFAEVRQTRPARLVILGEGEDRELLEQLARDLHVADDVTMPGYVDNPLSYMARASAFVLSSKWEGLPTVMIEALALGAPIVSTDCESGPREILDRGRLGILVPVGDSRALAHAILESLGKPRPRGSTSHPEAVERFTLAAVVPRYLERVSVEAPLLAPGLARSDRSA